MDDVIRVGFFVALAGGVILAAVAADATVRLDAAADQREAYRLARRSRFASIGAILVIILGLVAMAAKVFYP